VDNCILTRFFCPWFLRCGGCGAAIGAGEQRGGGAGVQLKVKSRRGEWPFARTSKKNITIHYSLFTLPSAPLLLCRRRAPPLLCTSAPLHPCTPAPLHPTGIRAYSRFVLENFCGASRLLGFLRLWEKSHR